MAPSSDSPVDHRVIGALVRSGYGRSPHQVRRPSSEGFPLPDRLRTVVITLIAIAATLGAPLAAHASATPPKVVIIVGPTGSVTASYRSQGNEIAAAATALGANVVKVYSPNANFANVKAAVNGANIVVYLGHGNGYPNPYSTTFLADRVDGWGLNRIAGIDANDPTGDGDNYSTNMAYCGEKALL